MKRLLLISLSGISVFLTAQEPFNDYEMQLLQEHAHPTAYAKLQKAMSFDADGYYRQKYVACNLLLRDKVTEKVCSKVDKAHDEWLQTLSPEKQRYYLKVIDSVNKDGNTYYQERHADNDLENRIDYYILNEVERARNVLEFPQKVKIIAGTSKSWFSSIMRYFGYDNPGFESIVTEEGNGYVNLLKYDHQSCKNNPLIVKHSLFHELTHIKFNDGCIQSCRDNKQLKDNTSKFNTLRYLQEDRADKYGAALSSDVAESFIFGLLPWLKAFIDVVHNSKINVSDNKYKIGFVTYNHPIKGQPDEDEHPSILMRYAAGLKLSKLHKAQKRWFGTREADAKYGNAYYEIAFAKAHEDTVKRESIKRWKNIQLNSF